MARKQKQDEEPNPKSELVRYTLDIPRDLHRKFKIACMMADTTMRDEIIRAIGEFVKEKPV